MLGLLLRMGVESALTGLAPCQLELPKSLTQGQLVIGRAAPNSTITFGSNKLRQAMDGRFVFGLAHNASKQLTLEVRGPQCAKSHRFNVSARQYPVERVDGLPSSTVTPDPEQQARIAREGAMISKARSHERVSADWLGAWQWPAQGRISGVYGSQRILNGEPRAPHLGLDIAAPTGTAVHAPRAGLVRLVHQDMLLTGGTLLIDHGFGISTIYIHLSAIDVAEGSAVQQGQKIAEIGATGRASGPHLHFQVHWFQEKLDPALVLPELTAAKE
jgi:murein DD-endopeptidase MepM/ murein hydrolase activator NlpD